MNDESLWTTVTHALYMFSPSSIDITCVIDTGKHREMRYDEKRQISRLRETFIARSNAQQRRGRAGRVQEGLAFHLFTKARHDIQVNFILVLFQAIQSLNAHLYISFF